MRENVINDLYQVAQEYLILICKVIWRRRVVAVLEVSMDGSMLVMQWIII